MVEVVNPSGERKKIFHIEGFSKVHDLNPVVLKQLIDGEILTHKGWYLYDDITWRENHKKYTVRVCTKCGKAFRTKLTIDGQAINTRCPTCKINQTKQKYDTGIVYAKTYTTSSNS